MKCLQKAVLGMAVLLASLAAAAAALVDNVQLSPNGEKAAYMVSNEGTTSIVVQQLGSADGKRTSIMSTDNKQYSFHWLHWVGNDRLLVGTIFPTQRPVADIPNTLGRRGILMSNRIPSGVGGQATHDTRLLSAKADGSQIVNLMKPTSFKGELLPQFQDQVIDFNPDDGRHVLIALADQQGRSDPVVYSLDVETGSRSHVYGPRTDFDGWMADQSHQVRLGIQHTQAGAEVHICDPDGKNWRKLSANAASTGDAMEPVGFGKDPNQLYLLADHEGHKALFTVDLRDATLRRTLKLADKSRDISGNLVYSRKTGEAVGLLAHGEDGKGTVTYWDKDLMELASFVNQALPHRNNAIVSMSDDELHYVVLSTGQADGAFYLGDDRANTLKLFAPANTRPVLKDATQ
jgi:hypothetical protein